MLAFIFVHATVIKKCSTGVTIENPGDILVNLNEVVYIREHFDGSRRGSCIEMKDTRYILATDTPEEIDAMIKGKTKGGMTY